MVLLVTLLVLQHQTVNHFSLSLSLDIDECALGTYICDPNAYCDNTIGSYDCICVDGYLKNGTVCLSESVITEMCPISSHPVEQATSHGYIPIQS